MNENQQEPLLQRIGLSVLGPIGLHFAPAQHVQVIYRFGAYTAARGPQFFWINPLVESVGPQVFIGNRSRVFVLENLPTRDRLQLGLKMWISFSFDPRRTLPDIATPLSNLNQDLMFAFMEGHARHALLAIIGAYAAEEVCGGGPAFQTIEQQMKLALEGRLSRLGIDVRDVRVTQVMPPPVLVARFEQAAQRGHSIQSMQEYHPSQVAQALAVELVERLGAQQADEQYVNIGDLLGAYMRGNAPSGESQGTPHSIAPPASQPSSGTGDAAQKNKRSGPASRSRF